MDTLVGFLILKTYFRTDKLQSQKTVQKLSMLLTILVSKKKVNKVNKDMKKDTKRKFTGL